MKFFPVLALSKFMRDAEKALIFLNNSNGMEWGNAASTMVMGGTPFLAPNAAFFTPYKEARNLWDQAGGILWSDETEQRKFDHIVILGTKQKEETAYLLACAMKSATKGAQIIMALENDSGGKTLDKLFEQTACPFEMFSKHKSRVVWTNNPEQASSAAIEAMWRSGQKVKRPDGMWTQAGVFSWKTRDRGTKAFLDCMPDDFSGIGADFGAGLGDLSQAVFTKNKSVEKMYVLDHDIRALECAKLNLEGLEKRTEFLWMDISRETPPCNLDFIVMNPPFHQGKQETIALGQSFLSKAYDCLKKRGRLRMVANIHLPYEVYLRERFSQINILYQKEGFKIIEAQK